MTNTDQYGVIGHPISHSKSPVIHGLFAKQTGEDIAYQAYEVEPGNLADFLGDFPRQGGRGLNVTVPHKLAAAELAVELTDRAARAGAVNTLTWNDDGGLQGDNTDGTGLVRDLVDNLGAELDDAKIVILGAGGATRGIVPALLDSGLASLTIANRTVNKAEELTAEYPDEDRLRACGFDDTDHVFDLIINATSAGLQGDNPPFSGGMIGPDSVCYDLSYAMKDTPFISWAKENGCARVHQGWGMLVEQAAESFLIWRGVRPDTDSVRDRLP